MIAIVAAVGLFIFVAVVGIAFGLGTFEDPPAEAVIRPPAQPSAFFVKGPSAEVQLEILLARLEQHVRQERAAVETFPDQPSAASLRCSTTSPLN
jgi:hypothetical protein